MYFLMDTYPILSCVWCACLLLYGVSNVVKEGSRSHLLAEIYTMHHFQPLLIYLRIYCACTCVDFMQVAGTGCRLP